MIIQFQEAFSSASLRLIRPSSPDTCSILPRSWLLIPASMLLFDYSYFFILLWVQINRSDSCSSSIISLQIAKGKACQQLLCESRSSRLLLVKDQQILSLVLLARREPALAALVVRYLSGLTTGVFSWAGQGLRSKDQYGTGRVSLRRCKSSMSWFWWSNFSSTLASILSFFLSYLFFFSSSSLTYQSSLRLSSKLLRLIYSSFSFSWRLRFSLFTILLSSELQMVACQSLKAVSLSCRYFRASQDYKWLSFSAIELTCLCRILREFQIQSCLFQLLLLLSLSFQRSFLRSYSAEKEPSATALRMLISLFTESSRSSILDLKEFSVQVCSQRILARFLSLSASSQLSLVSLLERRVFSSLSSVFLACRALNAFIHDLDLLLQIDQFLKLKRFALTFYFCLLPQVQRGSMLDSAD